MAQKEELKREIGAWGLALNAINIVVGAGIFVLPVLVAEKMGTSSIIAYLICGILISLIMLCFAEVGSKITQTGGAYSYIEVAFGKYAGFLTTTLFIFGYTIMSDAAVSNALADTLVYFIPTFKTPYVRAIFFIIIFAGLGYLNVRGISKGMSLVKITTFGKLIPLFVIILLGWTKISAHNLAWASTPGISDIGKTSLMLIFAFIGAETALNVSGEIKSPQKNIPKGIAYSLLIVIVLYILIQLTSQGILGDEFTNYKDAPLAEVANRILGPIGATIIILGAGISMFGNLSGEVLNMPRIIYAASRDDILPPKILSKVHPKNATPYIAIICYATLDCLFAIFGEFKQLAMLASASILLIYLGVVLAVIKLRRSRKFDDKGSFKIPGGYTIPVLAIIAIIWFLSNLAFNEQRGLLIFLAVMSVIYVLISRSRSRLKENPYEN